MYKVLGFCLMALFLALGSGCSTTSSQKTSSSAKSSSNRKIYLVGPDGIRREVPYRENPPTADFVAPPYEWVPDRSPNGPVRLEIVLAEQRIYIYRGGVEIGFSKISTGKEGYDTPPGSYSVLQKSKDYRSNLYGSFVDVQSGRIVDSNAEIGQTPPPGTRYEPAPMHYFQRLSWEGVGLHEGYLPGYPASHGCIRVHPHMAPILYSVTQIGTPVSIVRTRKQEIVAN